MGSVVRAGNSGSPGSPCFLTGQRAHLASKVTQQCQSPVILAGLLLPAAGGENCPAAHCKQSMAAQQAARSDKVKL